MSLPIPDRFPSQYSDRLNYINSFIYVPQIHIRADFSQPIDPARMARAMRLLLDAEPICGCRFVEHWYRPYWKRLDSEALDNEKVFEVQEGHEEEQAFLTASMDFKAGPQVRALLLTKDGKNRIVLKVSHLVADAGGTKELFYRLAEIYTKLCEAPDHQPKPRMGSRSLWQVYRHVPLFKWPRLLLRAFADALPSLRPFVSQRIPMPPGENGPLVFVVKRIGPGRVAEMAQYARERGATLNDLFVAAILRAVGELCGPEGEGFPRIGGTIDLRRHIPGRKTEALCNVSGLAVANPRPTKGQGLEVALVAAKEEMDALKSYWFGMTSLLFFRSFQVPGPYIIGKKLMRSFLNTIIRSANTCPAMTNLGTIEHDMAVFGGQSPVMAETFVPPSVPPVIVIGLSGYKGSLTLSAGVFSGTFAPEKVADLFDRIDKQIPK